MNASVPSKSYQHIYKRGCYSALEDWSNFSLFSKIFYFFFIKPGSFHSFLNSLFTLRDLSWFLLEYLSVESILKEIFTYFSNGDCPILEETYFCIHESQARSVQTYKTSKYYRAMLLLRWFSLADFCPILKSSFLKMNFFYKSVKNVHFPSTKPSLSFLLTIFSYFSQISQKTYAISKLRRFLIKSKIDKRKKDLLIWRKWYLSVEVFVQKNILNEAFYWYFFYISLWLACSSLRKELSYPIGNKGKKTF